MIRINLFLFLILIVFALLKVNTEHLYRKNFSLLDTEKKVEVELRIYQKYEKLLLLLT